MKTKISRKRGAVAIAVLVAVAGIALTLTDKVTRAVIIKREDEEKMRVIGQILTPERYDNRLLRDSVKLDADELLGTENTTTAYRARLQGKPSAVIMEAVAPDGYGGKIRLMLAVREDGEIYGVRVLAHNETTGWGDYIEIGKSKWIKMFEQTSMARYSDELWQVRKDGGRFDYVTRATVSARAIVGGVHRALKYYAANRDKLYRTDLRTIGRDD
jgi:Na+-translocating ferredoxin:NAD+ oxidoreductase subunit G